MNNSLKLQALPNKKANISNKITYKISVTPGEIWKNLKGYVGIYKISNFGRVKHIGHKSSNPHNTLSKLDFLVSTKLNKGYRQVWLIDDFGNKELRYVHKLVAEHFVDNPNGFKNVNHKDENKENNSASNLEWCDVLYNNTYNNRHIKVGIKERRNIKLFKIKNNEEVLVDTIKLTDIIKYHISVDTVYRYIDTDKAFYSRMNKSYYKVYSL